jgi:hypothetical protein
MAVLMAQQEDLQAPDLQPSDYQAWRQLLTQLQYREESHRQLSAFAKVLPLI